jgi:hypothetical protein
MKINIKNFIGILAFATLLSSCDTTNESNYTPEAYDAPASLTLTENATATTDNSFEVVYASSSLGKGYYAVVASGTTAPTSSQVHSGTGFIKSGNFNVDVTTPTTITVDSDVYGAYSYDVYGIHKSSDSFISETVTKLTVVTPDTAAPVFNGDTSSPSFQSGGISPFAPVTFNFSEPVFYQGGDITFTGFSSGRIITVNAADALTINGPNVTVNTHGTFEQDDFIIVTWAEGTFKDNSGKNVAGLSGFAHYFKTRLFTAPEAAALMVGTYNYETVFYGGFLEGFFTVNASLFLPSSGEFKLELDPSDATGTTLLGVNVYSPLANYGYFANENLKLKFGAEGALEILDEAQGANGLGEFAGTTADVTWGPYIANAVTALPGFYDVTSGNITQYLSLLVKDTGYIIDEMDYIYTRVGTFAKPSFEELEKKNAFLQKKRAQYDTYEKVEYKNLKIIN